MTFTETAFSMWECDQCVENGYVPVRTPGTISALEGTFNGSGKHQ